MFLLIVLVIPFLLANFSYGQEENDDEPILLSKLSLENSEEKLIHQFMETNNFLADTKNYSEADETEFLYTKSEDLEVKTEKLRKEDILRAVPSISTEDNKTLGLLIPPFAYFAKKF
jgi:hypothetical protein